MITPNGYTHEVRPITAHGAYNLTYCFYYAKDLIKLHREHYEIINIDCLHPTPHESWPTGKWWNT